MSFLVAGRAGARGLVVAALALIAAAAAPGGEAAAQGWIERIAPGDLAVHKLRTSVRVTVRERVAHVEVEEWFRNDGPPFGQADYLYPLPAGATFSSYSLWQGDDELRGEMMNAGEARRIYEEIVRAKRDPALIELVGHGLMRARVFPIATGETRRIRLRYTQVLNRAGDAIEFRYAAGRRNPGADRPLATPVPQPRPWPQPMPERPEPQPRNDRELSPRADQLRGGASAGAPLSFTLTAEDGALYGEPFSPTHALRVSREGGRLTVESRERLSGDLALFLPLAEKPVGITVATHRPTDSEDGWFMLTLSPAEVARARRVARDVTVVVDVSGSMSGGKLDQARGAVRQLLGTLGPQDRVRLIRFHSTVASWRSGWSPATAEALRDARRWVDELQADGGTNIAGALAEAFAQRTPRDRLGVVLFLTDGLPSVGERDPEQIALQAERERGEARVFAFGVGYDVNTYLLDRLSAAARGSTQYVQPDEDIETAFAALATRIQFPVLTDLDLRIDGAQLAEIYPTELPDLFAGEELVVLGRYSPRAGRATVTVAGRRQDEPERYQASAVFPQLTSAHDYLPRLWASRKIGELTQELRLHGHDRELEEEIQRTALRYGVLSEYTSYLVQEPNQVLAQGRAARAPAAFTGEAAVAQSSASKARREARTMNELQAADVAAAVSLEALVVGTDGAGAGANAVATRTVAGRTFRERAGVWEDVLHREQLRVVEVRAFSPAYFDLLRALPELKQCVAELPELLVAGAGVSIRLQAERGQEQLTAAALAALVRDFRGEKATTR